MRPYVKAQKNDERDAEAIVEAATRPTMRYVEVKSEAQLEVQSLQHVRGRLVAERTALINQLRALMLERGIIVPQGRCKLERYLPEILSNERNGLELRLRPNIHLWPRLGSLVGFGTPPGDDRWETEASTHLQTLATCGCCIHGARTALPGLAKKDTPLGRWLKDLLARAHRNVVIVALANKLARIAGGLAQTADCRRPHSSEQRRHKQQERNEMASQSIGAPEA